MTPAAPSFAPAPAPISSSMASPTWRVAAASTCGVSHERKGQPCQDAHAYEILPDGTLIAAVADGAGSAARSEIGSALAVKTALATLRHRPQAAWPSASQEPEWRALLQGVLEAARQALFDQATELGIPPRELASTLIVAVVTSDGAAAAQIGDGAAVARQTDGSLLGLTQPQAGEYINETTFLISPEAVPTAQYRVHPGKATHLAVFSDGLQMLALKMPEGLPHEPFFRPLFNFADHADDPIAAKEKLEALLRSPKVTARSDDDLTLLLAARG